jgi:hypothetical protein
VRDKVIICQCTTLRMFMVFWVSVQTTGSFDPGKKFEAILHELPFQAPPNEQDPYVSFGCNMYSGGVKWVGVVCMVLIIGNSMG